MRSHHDLFVVLFYVKVQSLLYASLLAIDLFHILHMKRSPILFLCLFLSLFLLLGGSSVIWKSRESRWARAQPPSPIVFSNVQPT